MPKLLSRILTVTLIPCLLWQPGWAALSFTPSAPSSTATQSLLCEQVLIGRLSNWWHGNNRPGAVREARMANSALLVPLESPAGKILSKALDALRDLRALGAYDSNRRRVADLEAQIQDFILNVVTLEEGHYFRTALNIYQIYLENHPWMPKEGFVRILGYLRLRFVQDHDPEVVVRLQKVPTNQDHREHLGDRFDEALDRALNGYHDRRLLGPEEPEDPIERGVQRAVKTLQKHNRDRLRRSSNSPLAVPLAATAGDPAQILTAVQAEKSKWMPHEYYSGGFSEFLAAQGELQWDAGRFGTAHTHAQMDVVEAMPRVQIVMTPWWAAQHRELSVLFEMRGRYFPDPGSLIQLWLEFRVTPTGQVLMMIDEVQCPRNFLHLTTAERHALGQARKIAVDLVAEWGHSKGYIVAGMHEKFASVRWSDLGEAVFALNYRGTFADRPPWTPVKADILEYWKGEQHWYLYRPEAADGAEPLGMSGWMALPVLRLADIFGIPHRWVMVLFGIGESLLLGYFGVSWHNAELTQWLTPHGLPAWAIAAAPYVVMALRSLLSDLVLFRLLHLGPLLYWNEHRIEPRPLGSLIEFERLYQGEMIADGGMSRSTYRFHTFRPLSDREQLYRRSRFYRLVYLGAAIFLPALGSVRQVLAPALIEALVHIVQNWNLRDGEPLAMPAGAAPRIFWRAA